MEHPLIQLYVWVWAIYDKHSALKPQPMSKNRPPAFTDQELATVYLFDHLPGHFSQRRIDDYLAVHWLAWFPDLPSYSTLDKNE